MDPLFPSEEQERTVGSTDVLFESRPAVQSPPGFQSASDRSLTQRISDAIDPRNVNWSEVGRNVNLLFGAVPTAIRQGAVIAGGGRPDLTRQEQEFAERAAAQEELYGPMQPNPYAMQDIFQRSGYQPGSAPPMPELTMDQRLQEARRLYQDYKNNPGNATWQQYARDRGMPQAASYALDLLDPTNIPGADAALAAMRGIATFGKNLKFFGVPDQVLEAGMRGAEAADEVTGTNVQRMYRGQVYPNPQLQQQFMDVEGRNLRGPGAYMTESKVIGQAYAVPEGLLDDAGKIDEDAYAQWIYGQRMKTGNPDLSLEDLAPSTTAMVPAVGNPFDFRQNASDMNLGGTLKRYLESDRFPVRIVAEGDQYIGGQQVPIVELTQGVAQAVSDSAVWFNQSVDALQTLVRNELSEDVLTDLKDFQISVRNMADNIDADNALDRLNDFESTKRDMYQQAYEMIVRDLRDSGNLTQPMADDLAEEYEDILRRRFSSEEMFDSIMREWAARADVPKFEAAPLATGSTVTLADTFNYFLRDEGYDSIIHLGGTRVGDQLHDVVAAFNKGDVIETYDDLMINILQNQTSRDPVKFTPESVDALKAMFPELEDESFKLVEGGFVMNPDNQALLDLNDTLTANQTGKQVSGAGRTATRQGRAPREEFPEPDFDPDFDPYDDYDPDEDDIFDVMDF